MSRSFIFLMAALLSHFCLSMQEMPLIEHMVSNYNKHTIYIENVKGVNITVKTSVMCEGSGGHFIDGKFLPIESGIPGDVYIGDLYEQHHDRACLSDKEPYMITIIRTFYFAANKNGNILLSLLIPSKFEIEKIDSVR